MSRFVLFLGDPVSPHHSFIDHAMHDKSSLLVIFGFIHCYQ